MLSIQHGRYAELVIAAAQILLPSRLHWSRDSAGVLAASGTALIGAGRELSTTNHPSTPAMHWLSRSRQLIIGATLFGVQDVLAEEEGSVRGRIAAIGGGLMVTGCLSRHVGSSSRAMCQ